MTPREAFRFQAEACKMLGSPFMGRLMSLCAERLEPGNAVADRILAWPGDVSPSGDSVPLRLAGALHALRLAGGALAGVYPPAEANDTDLWDAVAEAMVADEAHILAWLDSPPQTNEVRRSSALLAALAVVQAEAPGPVSLYELGTSGGLNLRADRFRLDLGRGRGIGPEDSAVRLTPDWRGGLPPADLPEVQARAGVDLRPVDPARDAGRLRLLAYLWPDQPERLALTDAAISVARSVAADISADDAGAWLGQRLAAHDAATRAVVFHTIAWQYFPETTRRAAEAAMAACPAPLARISMEWDGGQGAALTLSIDNAPPRRLARVDFHGRWVEWSAPT